MSSKTKSYSKEELYYNQACELESLRHKLAEARREARQGSADHKRHWKRRRDGIKGLLRNKIALLVNDEREGFIKRPEGFPENLTLSLTPESS